MPSRPGFIVSTELDVPSSSDPRRFTPRVTVELKLYYPPDATLEQVEHALSDMYGQAMHEAVTRIGYRPPRQIQRSEP